MCVYGWSQCMVNLMCVWLATIYGNVWYPYVGNLIVWLDIIVVLSIPVCGWPLLLYYLYLGMVGYPCMAGHIV